MTAAIAIAFALTAAAQSNRKFTFGADGKFKIAQFTDIHWCDDSIDHCKRSLASMQAVIDAEKPDLNVLTGDIVTDYPAEKGWKSIISFFEKQGIPFIVTMGNHDAEFMSKDSIYNMLTDSPMYAGIKGNHVSGYGNMTVSLYASDGSDKVKNVIYLIDSGDYAKNQFHAHYDWIHFDQIAWYRRESECFASKNGGKPVPSVMFLHIPLLETRAVDDDPDSFGQKLDTDAVGVNSGMFASILEEGDVVAVFGGHDHMNDYVGMRSGVALGYGRTSGWLAYGTLERGARILQLQEGSRHFDTWITTPKGKETVYHAPSGITSIDESQEYMPAKTAKKVKNGVAYSYYADFNDLTVSAIANHKVTKSGICQGFDIEQYTDKQPDHFAYVFTTLFDAPERAAYKFRLHNDDGAQLYIDGKLVLDNDGSHSAMWTFGKICLEKGLHRIEIKYFEDYMGQELKLFFQTPDIDETLVTPSMLFVETK